PALDSCFPVLPRSAPIHSRPPCFPTRRSSDLGKTERVGRMVEMHANERTELTDAQAGDIIAVIGMKNVQTGHTLCDPNHPCTLEAMVFPEPVISIAVAPKD